MLRPELFLSNFHYTQQAQQLHIPLKNYFLNITNNNTTDNPLLTFVYSMLWRLRSVEQGWLAQEGGSSTTTSSSPSKPLNDDVGIPWSGCSHSSFELRIINSCKKSFVTKNEHNVYLTTYIKTINNDNLRFCTFYYKSVVENIMQW